jgi:hypothetical protein
MEAQNYQVIHPHQLKEAVENNEAIFKTTSETLRMMYEEVFNDECSLKDFSLVVMAIGAAVHKHACNEDQKPKMDLDLSALEKLKKN